MRVRLFVCCLLFACSFAIADVAESFDYAAGSLDGQNGGTGWSSSWRNNFSRNGGIFVVSENGLSYPTVSSSGNAAISPNDGSRFQRDLDVMYDEGLVYVSFLMQCVTSDIDDEYSAIELQSGTDADAGRVFQIGVLRRDDGVDPGAGGNEEFYATVRDSIGGGRLESVKIADLDDNTHRFVIRFDLDTDIANIFVDPTADTVLGTGGIEVALYDGFSFDRIGLARFVGDVDMIVDEITVDYAGIDNVFPTIGQDAIDPDSLVFEWGAPTDPNIASITSYTVHADPNETYMQNNVISEFDYVGTGISGSQTISPASNSLAYNTDYFWRVTANVRYDDNTTGVIESPIWSFRTKLQDNPPSIDDGGDIITSIDLAQDPFEIHAIVEDDGTSPLDIEWQAYEITMEGSLTSKVVFSDFSIANPTITVSEPGTYVLKITATDAVATVSELVELRVYEDGCRAAKAAGTWQANYYDTNGDCIIDINDFAMFAIEWLDSTEMDTPATHTATVIEPVETNALIADVWIGVNGTDVEDLLNSPQYLLAPDFSYQVNGELRGMDIDNNTGQRIRGYIVPPVSGDYIFYISSDDKSRLFVSNDTNPVDTDPALANHIAEVSEYTAVDEWDKLEGQASDPISLVAGQYYYIEILHKELHVDTHVSVGWSTDGGATIEVIPGSALRKSLP